MSIPTQNKINNMNAEDFLNEKITVNDCIKLENQKEDEIKRGFR